MRRNRSFPKGETVKWTVACKDRDGADLDVSGGTVTLVFASAVDEGAPLLTFTSAGDRISVSTATATVALPASDLTRLTEGEPYFYDVWSTVGGDVIRQEGGRFRLTGAVQKD